MAARSITGSAMATRPAGRRVRTPMPRTCR
jgi:hypothetical protein